MQECPYCQKPNPVPSAAASSVINYGGMQLVATVCCQQPINVRRVEAVTFAKSITDRTEDDWGVPFNDA